MARSALLAAWLLMSACGGRSSLPARGHGPATGTGGQGGSGAAGGGAGGAGGAGGVVYPPGCVPGLPGPPIIEVPDLQGGSYCIDSTEVTNADYATFLAANPSTAGQTADCTWNTSFVPAEGWPPAPDRDAYPVAWVDWCDAAGYCAWAGKRLCGRVGGGALGVDDFDPVENEWTNACTTGGTFEYPYGPTNDPSACNQGHAPDQDALLPVASLPTCEGGSGLFDMAGNINEWTNACSGPGEFDWCRTMGGDFYFINSEGCYHELGFARSGPWIVTGIRCCRDAQ
ncbi:MAG: SUMF1/EgtB/PvdO family nonheme iron enzyme [Myxococcales bacterium]|nr:SUMF1/EgtB/PvdO family nonheme iron enzyme [Myxococcales bacterium]